MLPLSLWDNDCHDDEYFHHNEDDGNEEGMRDVVFIYLIMS